MEIASYYSKLVSKLKIKHKLTKFTKLSPSPLVILGSERTAS